MEFRKTAKFLVIELRTEKLVESSEGHGNIWRARRIIIFGGPDEGEVDEKKNTDKTMVHSRIHKLVYVSRNVFGGTISDGLLAEITYFPPLLELGIRSLIR